MMPVSCRKLGFVVAAAALFSLPLATASVAVAHDSIPHAQQVPDRLRIKRVTVGAEGRSQLDIVELPVAHHVALKSVVSRLPATDVEMGFGAPGSFLDWHTVSTPRLWIILQGAYEFGTGDGKIHRLEAGDIVLAADTTGTGHTSRNVGSVPAFVLTVRLPPGFALPTSSARQSFRFPDLYHKDNIRLSGLRTILAAGRKP